MNLAGLAPDKSPPIEAPLGLFYLMPVFLGLAKLDLLNTYAALIIPFVASVFGIFLFRQFFATLSPELIDAARVDGLTETAIVWRIAFPLAWPAATTFAVFSVVAHWNDLFWPLIAVSNPDLATPPRGISTASCSAWRRFRRRNRSTI